MEKKQLSTQHLKDLQERFNKIVKARAELQFLVAQQNALSLDYKEAAGFENLQSGFDAEGNEVKRASRPSPQPLPRPS